MSHTSPLSDALVTIFGGGGFVGNYVTQALLARGARVRIACRHHENVWPLKPLANLGQLQFAPCDLTHAESVKAALAGATHAVNLAGAFGKGVEQLMGKAPGAMAELANASGIRALTHVSAIGADAKSPTAYARAKALGEERVSAAFRNTTILRPSLIFGKDDGFINLFAGLIEMLPAVPVFAPQAELQLAYVDDVAEAVAVALEHPERHGGVTYELGGPERLSMMAIHQRIAAAQGREDARLLAMPDAVSGLFASLPGTPMSSDQWKLLKAGSVVSGTAQGFADLGIEPRPLGLFLDKWMTRYRKFGRFGLSNERAKEREATN